MGVPLVGQQDLGSHSYSPTCASIQICLKGKLHIFKYLSTEAGRRGAALVDLAPSHPPSFSPW